MKITYPQIHNSVTKTLFSSLNSNKLIQVYFYMLPSFNLSALSAAIKESIISSRFPFKKLSN